MIENKLSFEKLLSYLTKLEIGYIIKKTNDNIPYWTTNIKGIAETFCLNGIIFPEQKILYLWISNLFKYNENSEFLLKILSLNFKLLTGKIEYEPKNKEVRYSLTLPTDVEIPFEVFTSYFVTMISNAEYILKELKSFKTI